MISWRINFKEDILDDYSLKEDIIDDYSKEDISDDF